jgi:hypothetical protein
VYSNIERQLGKLAKVTAFLSADKKFYGDSVLFVFARQSRQRECGRSCSGQGDRATVKEEQLVRA